MSGLSLLPVFLIGLIGSVHCVGMCGGIVGAFSVASVPVRRFPLAVVAAGGSNAGLRVSDVVLRTISYNAGRIASYAFAGAIVGGIIGGARVLSGVSTIQVGGYWLANLMLIALGLYLMNAWRGLAYLESAGQFLWQRIQPLTKLLLPLDSSLKMLAVGALWGWLPCGMVYSVLLTAMLTGSALSGALVMLVFGLGTLPMLFAMGMLGARMRMWMQRRIVRTVGGLIVLGFGVLGLLRAAEGSPANWLDAICISPASAGL